MVTLSRLRETGGVRFPCASDNDEDHESETYVPEAALAKARKEGREEVREALIGEDAMLAWQGGYPLTVTPKTFEHIFAQVDSLAKEGS